MTDSKMPERIWAADYSDTDGGGYWWLDSTTNTGLVAYIRADLAHPSPVAALHRSFPEAGDGRPMPPMGDYLMTAGLNSDDSRFVAIQLAQNGLTLGPVAPVADAELDELETGAKATLLIEAEWKSCVHGGGWWVAKDADDKDVLLPSTALRARTAQPVGVGVKPWDTRQQGPDAMLPSTVDIHEGAWAAVIGSNGKPAGWIDTHDLFAHQIYRDRILSALLPEGGSTCRKCGGEMRPGIAMGQTYVGGLPDFPGDKQAITMSAGGPGKLIDAMKCSACGWSVTEGGA